MKQYFLNKLKPKHKKRTTYSGGKMLIFLLIYKPVQIRRDGL